MLAMPVLQSLEVVTVFLLLSCIMLAMMIVYPILSTTLCTLNDTENNNFRGQICQ